MLKRRSKTIAILTAFIFCLTFLGAAFVAPQVAEAAFTATQGQSNYVSADAGQNLGYFRVDLTINDWSSVTDDQLLVSYPTRIGDATNAPATYGAIPVAATISTARSLAGLAANELSAALDEPVNDSGIRIVVPNNSDNALKSPNAINNGLIGTKGGSFVIKIDASGTNVDQTKDKGWFFVYFEAMNTSNFAGDVTVNLVPQGQTAFGSTPASVIVGKVQTTKTTTTTAKSIENITSSGKKIDTITIFENMPNTLTSGGAITLSLETKGYYWDVADPTASGLFAYAGCNVGGAGFTAAAKSDIVTMTLPALPIADRTGAISISGLKIGVDEKVAKVGQDIEVKVKGAGVTEQTIVVAKYVDYEATVIEDTTTERIAGLSGKIGTFFIEEVAPGTLVPGRTILFELPAGVEWNTKELENSNYELANNSSITFDGAAGLLDNRTLKFTVKNTSENAQNGAKVKFKDLKVAVSPSFRGDIVLTVKGKAGVEGTAKVATVEPMITMTASTPELNLGIKEQKVSDVEIVETKADSIVARCDGQDRAMAFYLDSGFRFAKVPKVEVIEGDMVLEVNDVKIQAPASGQNLLIVPIRAASYKTPAKIKISDIYVTADRNAPVGDVILYAADTETYAAIETDGNGNVNYLCNAFNSTHKNSFKYDTPASVAIAKNMTVPPVEVKGGSGSGTFVIGSNIYTVNGLTKVMDTAPYIKNDRTYVPYRYLALALGVAEEDIVWDAATQKVTVTKGDNVVEATIGSTTLTVNGEAVTMDVAPEINNDRTMLPARYLAEALGAVVGWDPATRTVVFEM